MATSDLYGWFPTMSQPLTAPDQNRWTIPERGLGALPVNQDPTGSNISTQFGMGPLSQLAYGMAGSPTRGPVTGVNMPYSDYPDDAGNSSSGGVLPLLQDASQGKKLYDKVNGGVAGDPAIQQPSQLNELGSKLGLTSGLSPGWASGANLNNAAASQLSYPSALGFDSSGLATGYAPAAALGSSLAGIGSGAAANAALGEAGFLGGWATPSVEASLAGASGAGAGAGGAAGSAGASGATGAAGASAGLSGLAAGGIGLGIVAAAAPFLHGNYDNELRNHAMYAEAFPGVDTSHYQRFKGAPGIVTMPDGALLTASEYDDLTNAWHNAYYETNTAKMADGQAYLEDFSKRLASGEGFFYAGKKNPWTGQTWNPGD